MSAEPPPHETRLVVPPPKKAGPLSGGAGAVLAVVLLGGAAYLFYTNLWRATADDPVETLRWFKCTDDGNAFAHSLKKGDKPPVACPKCKKTTGYPAEACYWTRDGGVKDTPTYVILNKHLGKEGDTICPDCGRVVVGHNPDPRRAGGRAERAAPTSEPTTSAPDRDARG